MASYVSDCKNVYIAPNGDSGMNNNYKIYSSPQEASSNCLTDNNYYVNNFSSYGPGGLCNTASSNVDGAGYVSDGINYWLEGVASYDQSGASNTTPGNPDWGSAYLACQNGQPWPIALTGTAPPIYQLYNSSEGFMLFKESSMNVALVFFILVVIGIAVYYFMRK